MRTFKGSNVSPFEGELLKASTLDFIKQFVPHKTSHFLSREGIVQVVPKIPKNFESFTRDQPESFKTKFLAELNRGTMATSRFVFALHSAFDKHIPFSISPEVIWNIISQEVGQYVKSNSDNPAIASLFTTQTGSQEKLVVEIPFFVYGSKDNNWLEGIGLFRSQLTSKVPSKILEVMTPTFTTATPETEISHLISFMDATSKYYSFGMATCCGIPEFRIEGEPNDWENIIASCIQLEEMLPGLALYFKYLVPTLTKIKATLEGDEDRKFWSSIYKISDESGGPYSNGWFNNFYAYVYNCMDYKTKKITNMLKTSPQNAMHIQLNDFPSNLSYVEFEWQYFDKTIPMAMVSGVTSVEMDSGFLTPKLGVAVLEK
jgi:hypothetical protein